MPRRKAIRIEIAIYNNLIQRTKRGCITIYIYIYIFIEINALDLLRNELLEKRRCHISFSKDTTLFFTPTIYACSFLPNIQYCSSFVIVAHDLISSFSIRENSMQEKHDIIILLTCVILNRFVSRSTAFAPFVSET